MGDKPDIVDFIETHCGIELLEYEKEFIRKAYSAGPDAKLVFPRHMGRTDFRLLAKMTELYFKGEQNENTKD